MDTKNCTERETPSIQCMPCKGFNLVTVRRVHIASSTLQLDALLPKLTATTPTAPHPSNFVRGMDRWKGCHGRA
eukprot:scaffold4955_cov204-Amphora_coffeaeformis.AAC.5